MLYIWCGMLSREGTSSPLLLRPSSRLGLQQQEQASLSPAGAKGRAGGAAAAARQRRERQRRQRAERKEAAAAAAAAGADGDKPRWVAAGP